MPALIVAEQEEAPAQGFVLGSTIALAFVLPFSGIYTLQYFELALSIICDTFKIVIPKSYM